MKKLLILALLIAAVALLTGCNGIRNPLGGETQATQTPTTPTTKSAPANGQGNTSPQAPTNPAPPYGASVTQPAPANTACAQESRMLAPQGEWLTDGRFAARDLVAPAGWTGIIFDGQEVRGGDHFFRIFGPQVREHIYVQGTWYAICPELVSVAQRIAGEKQSRNPGLTIHVVDNRTSPAKEIDWKSGQIAKNTSTTAQPSLQAQPQPGVAQPSASQPQASQATTTNWSNLGIASSRLEVCPGEAADKCVHVKDGPVSAINVQDGATYEGWDGKASISGNGPKTVNAAGLTVRVK